MSNIGILASIRNNFEYNSSNIIRTISTHCSQILYSHPREHDVNQIFTNIVSNMYFNNTNFLDNYLHNIIQKTNCDNRLNIINENINKLHVLLFEYSNIMIPCIDTYIKTQVIIPEDNISHINMLLQKWNLFTTYNFIASLSSEENTFMTYEPNSTKPVDVLEYKRNNGKIIEIKHSLFMEHISRLLHISEVFDFDQEDETIFRLSNYIYNLSLHDRNELLHCIANGSIMELNYFAPLDFTEVDSVLVIIKDDNFIKEIHFCHIEEWRNLWSEQHEHSDNFVDVPITISFRKYKEVIKRERLTKKKQKKNNIPESCCICLEKFKIGNQIHSTPCNHFYHAKCLKKQLCSIGPPKCPMCRHDVREEIDSQIR